MRERLAVVASKCPPLVEGRWAGRGRQKIYLKSKSSAELLQCTIHNVDEVESLKDLPFFKTTTCSHEKYAAIDCDDAIFSSFCSNKRNVESIQCVRHICVIADDACNLHQY